jgi:hypothetical protein
MKKNTGKKGRLQLKQKHKAAIRSRRPAHKKILLHPVAVFLILCTGVLLLSWTWRAGAADYAVRAKVPAPPLTQPAVITSPADGSHFKTKPVTVAGTCPYKSYINLYRNSSFSGTALCEPDGTFSLQTDLSPAANLLEAHVFNITDDEGPLGPPVTIYYDAPQPPVPSNPQSTSNPNASTEIFRLTSDYLYKGYSVGEDINWTVSISGGTGPYAFNIKWGDGSEANYVKQSTGAMDIEHIYSKSGVYDVKINGTDVAGGQAFLQLSALVVTDKNAAITGTANSSGGPTIPQFAQKQLSTILWPAYAVVAAMVFSFWLGEMQEAYVLTHHSLHRRPRRR